MPTPWGIIIALFVLGLALLIKHLFANVLEEDKAFALVIVGFIVVYAIAAVAVGSLNPLQLVSSQAFAEQTQE